MRCFEMYEIQIQTRESELNPDSVEAVFECENQRTVVPGFYDGNGIYKVRFLPRTPGQYHYVISGAVEKEGYEYCEAAKGKHGMVVVEGCHFCYEDGAKYYPFGTTVYALIHQEEWLLEQTLQTLKEACFNKVRMCVFPKSYQYNENEPEYFAFEKDANGKWDVERPCLRFWRRLENTIQRLGDMGIEVDLILFHPYDRWGFAELSMEENRKYLDLVLARLSAFPNVWWSLANEYDLMKSRILEDWYEIDEYISRKDPYGHLLSNHQLFRLYDYERPAISHCCIQSSWVQNVSKIMSKYRKPVIYDEMRYEGNIIHGWGSITAFEMVHRFWCVCVQGGYGTHGETYYNDEEILWWSKGGMLYGQSPKRIGWLKEILYELPDAIEPIEDNMHYLENRDLTVSELTLMEVDGKQYIGHCGDDVFLFYYGRQCSREAVIELPVKYEYKVEVLDIWEMERKCALECANGKITVPLPSKEGIALLATRVSAKKYKFLQP